MIKQYIKQALQMIKENRLISAISIIGTAISIAMIMIVVLVIQIQVVNYYPENNRDRMLFIDSGGTQATSKDGNNWDNGNMSPETAKGIFYPMQTPEAVTAYADKGLSVSLMDRRSYTTYDIKATDPGFWKVFSFQFLEGSPFSQADFDSGIRNAVISEKLAQKLFGKIDVVGQEIRLDLTPYRICGVVKEVSKVATVAHADVWIPYTCDVDVMRKVGSENIPGELAIVMLAKNASDFETIKAELKQNIAKFNATKQDYEVSFFENPITQWDKVRGSSGQVFVKWKDYWLETGGLLLFLLIVPALNLLGVTQSSVQKRQAEIGVRKAFGATSQMIIRQVLYENGVITLIGGVIGLILSLLLLPVCKNFLLRTTDASLNLEMLFQPFTFVIALLFCLALNLLSAGLPAWMIARKPISDAIKNEEETNK